MTHYVTVHIQKTRRITLGTCMHKYKDCQALKSRTGITTIAGGIVQILPKCNYCFNRGKLA